MKRNKPGKGWLMSLRFSRISSAHHDKILPETRWIVFFMVPFLLTGAIVLTFWPDDTELLFAWPVQSRMTALLLGAVFAGGVYYFSRVFLARHWHTVGMGFLPASIFAVLGGLATIINWETFTHSALAFFVWVVTFAMAPWLIPLVWFRNRSQDPRMPNIRDVVLSKGFSRVCFILSAANLAVGTVLFLFPDLMIGYWPWTMAPLAARILGALFVVLGSALIAMAIDRRWSAAQVILETIAITTALILVGVARSWSSFNLANPLTWIFTGWVVVLMVSVCVFYLWVEIR